MAGSSSRRLLIGAAVIGTIVIGGAVVATALDQPGYALGAAGLGVVALFVLIGRAKRGGGP